MGNLRQNLEQLMSSPGFEPLSTTSLDLSDCHSWKELQGLPGVKSLTIPVLDNGACSEEEFAGISGPVSFAIRKTTENPGDATGGRLSQTSLWVDITSGAEYFDHELDDSEALGDDTGLEEEIELTFNRLRRSDSSPGGAQFGPAGDPGAPQDPDYLALSRFYSAYSEFHHLASQPAGDSALETWGDLLCDTGADFGPAEYDTTRMWEGPDGTMMPAVTLDAASFPNEPYGRPPKLRFVPVSGGTLTLRFNFTRILSGSEIHSFINDLDESGGWNFEWAGATVEPQGSSGGYPWRAIGLKFHDGSD